MHHSKKQTMYRFEVTKQEYRQLLEALELSATLFEFGENPEQAEVVKELLKKVQYAEHILDLDTAGRLEQAIKKAKPNLDKIKDVDKHLDNIR